MLSHLMQNKLSSVGSELEKDRCKGVEMRELNDRKIHFTGPLLHTLYVLLTLAPGISAITLQAAVSMLLLRHERLIKRHGVECGR